MVTIIAAAIAVIGSIIGGAMAAKANQYFAAKNRQQSLENYDYNRNVAIIEIAASQDKQKMIIEAALLISALAMVLIVMLKH